MIIFIKSATLNDYILRYQYIFNSKLDKCLKYFALNTILQLTFSLDNNLAREFNLIAIRGYN